MMRRGCLRMAALLLACCAVTPVSAAASASKEKLLGRFGAWHAYSYKEGGQTVCYMVTTELVRAPSWRKRAAPYLMITHRPVEASTDVVSYNAGLRIDDSYGAKIQVGKARFDLFSARDTAWARTPYTDHKIAAAVKTAARLHITSLPDRKHAHAMTDIFDVSGGAAAHRAINRACGLPDDTPKKPHAAKKKHLPRRAKTRGSPNAAH